MTKILFIKKNITQVMDITFKMNMKSLVYAHHYGQFFDPDTNSKVSIKMGQMLFMDVIHDVSL